MKRYAPVVMAGLLAGSALAPVAMAETSTWLLRWRQPEAATFRSNPGIAKRSGDILTISLGGKPVASFTDVDNTQCEGNETCSLWHFGGTTELQTRPGKPERLAIVVHNNGEYLHHVLVKVDGTTHWLAGDFKASPDKRFVAAGQQEDVLSEGFLEIVDFASSGHRMKAAFDAQCDPVRWETGTRIKLICSRNDENTVEVAATAEQIAPDTWSFREDKVQKNVSEQTVTLRKQTVRMTADIRSAKETAEANLYEQTVGYRRLVP